VVVNVVRFLQHWFSTISLEGAKSSLRFC